ncbi:hypothetical protein ILYODFUR_022027, partial [Ilyodon furcidens]
MKGWRENRGHRFTTVSLPECRHTHVHTQRQRHTLQFVPTNIWGFLVPSSLAARVAAWSAWFLCHIRLSKETGNSYDLFSVLYLQYGDETKQIRMPNEITSIDTIRALFVSAFPQQLNMKMLESPSVAVYVKDDMRNMYYELADVRNITDHACLKVYHKDPAQAFSHGPRPANGDAR